MAKTYGFDEFISRLNNIEKDFAVGAVKVLEETGDEAVAETQMRTPVDTGTLRRSIQRGDVVNYTVKVGSGKEASEYADFIENGTRFISPYYMLRDGSTVAKVRLEKLSKQLFKDITKEFKI